MRALLWFCQYCRTVQHKYETTQDYFAWSDVRIYDSIKSQKKLINKVAIFCSSRYITNGDLALLLNLILDPKMKQFE